MRGDNRKFHSSKEIRESVHPHMRGDNLSILPLPEPGWDALMSEREPYLSRVRAVGAMAITVIER
jgi:hypothetical protein